MPPCATSWRVRWRYMPMLIACIHSCMHECMHAEIRACSCSDTFSPCIRTVKCPCGCSNGPASSWYHGLQKCSKGSPTKQEWLDTFKVKEIVKAVKAKKETKKKATAESSSNATTPTKDGDNADKDTSDEEAKEKSAAKKQKIEKEPKTPKAKKAKPAEDANNEPKEKRPQTAFFLFSEAKRAEAREADPSSKSINAKELGEAWKALTDEEKEPYTTKAAAAKAEYVSKKVPTESEKKKTAKAEGPPKARTAYLIFNSEERVKIIEEFPGIKASEIMKLQGARWKELSPENKKIYEDKAKAEKESIAAGGGKIDTAGSKRKSPEPEKVTDEEEEKEEEEDQEDKSTEEKDEEEEEADKSTEEESKEEKEEDHVEASQMEEDK